MRIGRILKNIFVLLLLIFGIIIFCYIYSNYNYGNYIKSVSEREKTSFTRDSDIKYSSYSSYKLENKDFNDAMFFQTIQVTPNTPYRVTCMVKTEDVQNIEGTTGGAHISIADTTERSICLDGDNDWTKLEFLFNSKNRTSVNIAFRLGGYKEKVTGTACFSDFKIEMGVADTSNEWNFGCFIFENIDVNVDVNGKVENVNLSMDSSEIQEMKENMERFANSFEQMSKGKMNVKYDTIVIEEPITTISIDEDNGYYVDPNDVYDQINDIVQKNEYDHIYVALKMGDKEKGNEILIQDWIGLGGMEYWGTGFSNIRLPSDKNNYIYVYDPRINLFPEEVFIHEFLHTLERNSKDYGYDVIALHDNSVYGYEDQRLTGLRNWYEDYMNCNVEGANGEKLGIPAEMFTHKPPHNSNFNYSYELNEFKEPENIIEEIRSLFSRATSIFAL